MKGRVGWPIAIAVALLAAAVTAAAIAGGPAAPGDQAVEIALTEYAFGPSDPVIGAGVTRLRLVNAGIRRHNLVLLVDGVERASPEVRPGDTVEWELSLEQPGRYIFWCGEYRHLEKGMAGALVVETIVSTQVPN